MQLGTWTIPLLPAVAVGVAVVLAGLVLWGVHRVRGASGTPAGTVRHDDPVDPLGEPHYRDWTGEAAGGAADPPPAAPARPRTVADAVAARGADTQPLAAVAATTPPTAWGADAGPEPAGPAAAGPAPAGPPTGDRTLPGPPTGVSARPGPRTGESARPGPPPAASTASPGESLSVGAESTEPASAAERSGEAPPVRPRVGQHRLVEDAPHDPASNDPDATHQTPEPIGGADGSTARADELAGADDTDSIGRPAVAEAGDPATGVATAPALGGLARTHTSPGEASTGDGSPDEPCSPEEVREGSVPERPSTRAGGDSTDSPGEATRREAPAADDRSTSPPDVDGPLVPDVRRIGDGLGSASGAADAAGAVEDPAGDGGDDLGGAAGDDLGGEAGDEAGDRTAAVVPELEEDVDDPEPVETGPVPPPWSPSRTASAGVPDDAAGSPEPVSFAVQQALAARAVQRARGRADVPDLAEDDVPLPSVPDARDRLLAVLLTDPVTALGATTELDDTRARIDQLGDVLRRRRADLATAVHRLHASGLTGEQIGELADLDCDDVREILEQPSGEGSSGR